jgi:rare lipoprotein A
MKKLLLLALIPALLLVNVSADKVVASYYHDKYQGRLTASGEPFDNGALTAAHRTLPFGTRVRVAITKERFVVVTINDRGPFIKGREIDLSQAAFKKLCQLEAGLIKVRLTVLTSNK